jgi:hypothetical protein
MVKTKPNEPPLPPGTANNPAELMTFINQAVRDCPTRVQEKTAPKQATAIKEMFQKYVMCVDRLNLITDASSSLANAHIDLLVQTSTRMTELEQIRSEMALLNEQMNQIATERNDWKSKCDTLEQENVLLKAQVSAQPSDNHLSVVPPSTGVSPADTNGPLSYARIARQGHQELSPEGWAAVRALKKSPPPPSHIPTNAADEKHQVRRFYVRGMQGARVSTLYKHLKALLFNVNSILFISHFGDIHEFVVRAANAQQFETHLLASIERYRFCTYLPGFIPTSSVHKDPRPDRPSIDFKAACIRRLTKLANGKAGVHKKLHMQQFYCDFLNVLDPSSTSSPTTLGDFVPNPAAPPPSQVEVAPEPTTAVDQAPTETDNTIPTAKVHFSEKIQYSPQEVALEEGQIAEGVDEEPSDNLNRALSEPTLNE